MRQYVILFIITIALGVLISPVHAQTIYSGLILTEKKEGIMIVDVQPGNPGFDAGLRTGDIVIEIEGKKIETFNDYIKISREAKDKEIEVSLVIRRDGVNYDATIKAYSVPVYMYWKEKVMKPVELPRGLTDTPYEYWIDKGNRALKQPGRKGSNATIANYNNAIKYLYNGLHFRPESIDAALNIANTYHELGNLYVENGNLKEGIENYRKSIKFYAGCHEKTQNKDHLKAILSNLQEIEKELIKIETGKEIK